MTTLRDDDTSARSARGRPAGVAADEISGNAPCAARITLLGGLSLECNGEHLKTTTSTERLLALLALRGSQLRTYLAGTLWPDIGEDQALTRLRCTLWRVRRQCPNVLESHEHAVSLSSDVVVDVHGLDVTAREVIDGGTPPELLDDRRRTLVDSPELLVGWYEDWVLQERDRINQLRIRALESLVDQLLAVRHFSEAFEAATAAIGLDPLRESTHRAAIRVHLAEGNPALARRHVDRYREILRAELGVDAPTDEMLAMVTAAGVRALAR